LSAEFVGTLLLVLIGCLSGLYASPDSNAVIHSAFGHGLAVFVLVASFGHIRSKGEGML
jgi:glycerol uptake facilitator-like aquaporin